jgi:hypothetical protein
MRRSLRSLSSLTLVELLLAMSLLATICIATASIDLAARNFFRASRERVEVVNELGFILEHIHKYASLAHGWDGNRGIARTGTEVEIRLDAGDPGNFSDDTWISYRYFGANNSIVFCDNWDRDNLNCAAGVEEILSSRIVANDGGGPLFNLSASNTSLIVDITSRHNVSEAASVRKNPEVNLRTTIFFREHSVR